MDMRGISMCAASVALAILVVAAQVDVTKVGPQPGARAADFQLPDQHGKPRSLASLAGPNGTMLVFFRSAEWCPYCRTQLVELQRNLPVISREGYGLAAVSYDPPATLRAFAAKHGVTYPLLSDAGSKTIAAWGLLNRAATGREAGIPHPGTFLIDRTGRVVERAFEALYQERSTAASVLARLGAPIAPVQPTPIVAPHLAVRSGASDAMAAPGDRFTLIVDATPGPKIHVYSPDQKNYIPVALKLEASPDWRAHPPRFPPSGTYFFAPLNETVRVYTKPFRITQDVTLALSPDLRKRATAKESVTITGTLQYQACDDAVCYRPESVPLRWVIALAPLVR
jgi:peroxiredoxin